MFKKYGIGMLAVIFAISLYAFTSERKPLVDHYVFEYVPPTSGDYSQTSEQLKANWVYQSKNLAACVGTQTKACRISVIDTYVNNPSAPSALVSSFSITALPATGTAKVTNITNTVDNSFSNKP